MKKILAMLLCVCFVLSLAACGNSPTIGTNDTKRPTGTIQKPSNNNQGKDPTEDTNANEPNEEGALFRAELLHDEDSDEYKLISSLQGKFQYIENSGTGITFIADGKWYIPAEYPGGAGKYELRAESLPNDAYFWYFDSVKNGSNLLCYSEGMMHRYRNIAPKQIDFAFNPETDVMINMDNNGFYVLTKDGAGYIVTEWASNRVGEPDADTNRDDIAYATTKEESVPVSMMKYRGSRGEFEALIANIVTIKSTTYGQMVFAITNDGDAYIVEDVHISYPCLEVTTALPVAEDVDKIFSCDVDVYGPIYSKNGDTSKLYFRGHGADAKDWSDDVDLGIVLPDGYTTADVVKVIQCDRPLPEDDCAMVVFLDGSAYMTKPLDDSVISDSTNGFYELYKIDVVSEINQKGEAKALVSGSKAGKLYIYVLTNDGELLVCDVSSMVN